MSIDEEEEGRWSVGYVIKRPENRDYLAERIVLDRSLSLSLHSKALAEAKNVERVADISLVFENLPTRVGIDRVEFKMLNESG